jgi:hypothetical protein
MTLSGGSGSALASLRRSRGETKHVGAERALCAQVALGRIQRSMGIDEAFEFQSEPPMRWTDKNFGLVSRPSRQTANAAPGSGFIVGLRHASTMTGFSAGQK